MDEVGTIWDFFSDRRQQLLQKDFIGVIVVKKMRISSFINSNAATQKDFEKSFRIIS